MQMSHPAYKIIDSAKADLEEWANIHQIPIHRYEFVAVFESWSDSHSLWIFYPTNKDLEKLNKNGTSEKIKQCYQQALEARNFPFSEFPKAGFEFDSDENVRRNYAGNYFYRLR